MFANEVFGVEDFREAEKLGWGRRGGYGWGRGDASVAFGGEGLGRFLADKGAE